MRPQARCATQRATVMRFASSEKKTTAGLGGTRGPGVARPGRKPSRSKNAPALETLAAEPAEEFLCAVADKEQPDRRSR